MQTKYARTFHAGKVAFLENQWVQTEYILVMGLLIVPVSSMLVIPSARGEETTFKIPNHSKSVFAGYARITTFILAIAALIYALYHLNAIYPWYGIKWLLISAALGLAYYYFRKHFGKPAQEEITERSKLGKAIGMYILPGWIYEEKLYELVKEAQYGYKEKFNSDWRLDITAQRIPREQLPLLYALSLFDYMIHPTDEMGKHLNRVDELYAQF